MKGKRLDAVLRRLCGEPIRQSGSNKIFKSPATGANFVYAYHDGKEVTGDQVRRILMTGCRADQGRSSEGGPVTNFHVIYRHEQGDVETWSSYSYPVSVYTAGDTLDEVRRQFREAALFGVDDFEDHQLIEHIEEPLIEGAYTRTSIDRRTLDRQDAAKLFRATMEVADQRADFEATAPLGGSGDAVMVAGVASDTVNWLLEQMGDHDALSVCVAAPGPMMWWSYLAGQHAVLRSGPFESLADGGLTTSSTLSEFIRTGSARRTQDGRVGEGFQGGLLVGTASGRP